MKRDHKKISATAFHHIIWRTFYGVPFADGFVEVARKYIPEENIYDMDILKKIAPIFEARYRGGEQAMEKFIEKNPECVVLELAAGFSLHGLNLTRKYPKLTYIETDLPHILKLKEKIMKIMGVESPKLFFRIADALDEPSIKKTLSETKPGAKLLIYCEGLLGYFDSEEKEKIAKTIEKLLREYDGIWITPDPALDSSMRAELKKALPAYKMAMKKTEEVAGQNFADHGFVSEKQTDKFFSQSGFEIKKLPWPKKLRSMKNAKLEAVTEKNLRKVLGRYGKTWMLAL